MTGDTLEQTVNLLLNLHNRRREVLAVVGDASPSKIFGWTFF